MKNNRFWNWVRNRNRCIGDRHLYSAVLRKYMVFEMTSPAMFIGTAKTTVM